MENREIPNGWRETTLGEVIELVGGGTPKTSVSEYWNGNIPWLSVVDFSGNNRWVSSTEKSITELGLKNSSTKLLEINDLIISARGTVGELAQLKKVMAFNQSCYGIKKIDTITDTDYLYYLVKFSIVKLKRKVHGAVFDTITRQTFDTIDIILPPLPEQKAIADVLSSLDEKIELLEEENKTLETLAQTIFTEWFVNFNFPGATGEMEESELGEIPKGWRVGKLGDIIKTSFGGDWGKDTLQDDYNKKVTCIRGTDLEDITSGSSLRTPTRYIKNSKFEKVKVEVGDIIIEISGGTENQSTGRVSYINEEIIKRFDNDIISVNFCRVLRTYENTIYFIYVLFKKMYNEGLFFNWENGTTGIKNLALKDMLEKLDIIIPQEEQITEFNEFCNIGFSKIQNNAIQIQTLKTTRDAILPKLMSGEIRVEGFGG